MSVLCPCGKMARKGHECAVTRLRAESSAKDTIIAELRVARLEATLDLDAALALLQRWKNRRNGNRKFQLWSDTTAFLKQQRAA